MKIDFLRRIKIFLYAVSFAEIFIFGYLAGKTGNNIKMAAITLLLLFINFVVYKAVKKHVKKTDGKYGV